MAPKLRMCCTVCMVQSVLGQVSENGHSYFENCHHIFIFLLQRKFDTLTEDKISSDFMKHKIV